MTPYVIHSHWRLEIKHQATTCVHPFVYGPVCMTVYRISWLVKMITREELDDRPYISRGGISSIADHWPHPTAGRKVMERNFPTPNTCHPGKL